MTLSDEVIDYLIGELEKFRQNHPVSQALQAQYAAAPIELMARTFLEVFLEPEKTEQAADTIARTAIENQIPYAVLMADINALKQALMKNFRQAYSDPFEMFERLDTAIETSKNAIARRYLHEAAKVNSLIPPHGKTIPQRLVEIYDRWFSALRQALLDDDLMAFEKLALDNKAFLETVEHPETLMVCADTAGCQEVRDAHTNIMRLAVLLHGELLVGRDEKAYLLYVEMQAAVRQLVNLLITFYLNYETNRLKLFFNLLESAPYLNKPVYLSVINVRGLRQLNELQGEDKGDLRLRQVEEALDRFVAEHHAHYAYVRGLLGDFYMISIGLEGDAVREDLRNWVAALPEDVVYVSTINLKKLEYVERPNLRFLIQYLHEQKEGVQPLLIDSSEEIRAVNHWIVEKLEANFNLQKLLTPGNLSIHVQPLVDTADGKIFAFETLGRLNSGNHQLSAGLFVDRLVELNLIEQFDILILDEICNQAEQLEKLTDTLFVNCSPASLGSRAYAERLKAARQGVLKNMQLVVELTEQAMLEHTASVKKLHEELGIQFAIDDFGSGYSSLP